MDQNREAFMSGKGQKMSGKVNGIISKKESATISKRKPEEDINDRAEAFINRFHKQLQREKIRSSTT